MSLRRVVAACLLAAVAAGGVAEAGKKRQAKKAEGRNPQSAEPHLEILAYKESILTVKERYDRCKDLFNEGCYSEAVGYCEDAERFAEAAHRVGGQVRYENARFDTLTESLVWYEEETGRVLDIARTRKSGGHCVADRPTGGATVPVTIIGGTGGALTAKSDVSAATAPLALQAQGEVLVDQQVRVRQSRSSPALLPPGYLQFDLGWTFAEQTGGVDSGRSQQIGQTTVRWGLRPRFEMRFLWSGYTRAEQSGLEAGGVSDGAVEGKIALWKEKGARPATSVAVGVNVPVGDDPVLRCVPDCAITPGPGEPFVDSEFFFSSERFDPYVTLLGGHTLGRGVSLTYNAGATWASSVDSGVTQPGGVPGRDVDTLLFFTYSAAVDFVASRHRHGGRRVQVYLEFFGSTPINDPRVPTGTTERVSTQPTRNSVDAIVSYLLADKPIGFYAFVGKGLSDAAPDTFAGAGITLSRRTW